MRSRCKEILQLAHLYKERKGGIAMFIFLLFFFFGGGVGLFILDAIAMTVQVSQAICFHDNFVVTCQLSPMPYYHIQIMHRFLCGLVAVLIMDQTMNILNYPNKTDPAQTFSHILDTKVPGLIRC
jgi:hypothetical protein